MVNLKKLPAKVQLILFSNLRSYLQRQSFLAVKKNLTFLGIKPYKIMEVGDKKILNKKESIQAIMEYLQKNQEQKKRMLEKYSDGISSLCLSSLEKSQFDQIIKGSQIKVEESVRQRQVVSKEWKNEEQLKKIEEMKIHQDETFRNLVKSIQERNNIDSVLKIREEKKQKKKCLASQRQNSDKFQLNTLHHLENDLDQDSPLLKKPIDFLRKFQHEHIPIFSEYSVQIPKKYQIQLEELRINLPREEVHAINLEIDQFLREKGQDHRKIYKQIIFGHLKGVIEYKLGKNKVKTTSEALQSLTIMKEIHFESIFKKRNPLIHSIKENLLLLPSTDKINIKHIESFFKKIKVLITQTKLLDLFENYEELKNIKEFFCQIVNSNVKFQEFTLQVISQKVSEYLVQIQKEEFRLSSEQFLKNKIEIILYMRIFTHISEYNIKRKQSKLAKQVITVGQKLCQLILISESIGQKNIQISNEIKTIQTYFLMEGIESMSLIIDNRQKLGEVAEKVEILDLAEIFETSQYLQIVSRIYIQISEIFPLPSPDDYQSLIDQYSSIPNHYPPEIIYSIIIKFSEFYLQNSNTQQNNQNQSQKNALMIYAMMYQIAKSLFALPSHQIKQNGKFFKLLISILNEFEQYLKQIIKNNSESTQDVPEYFCAILSKIILKFISTTQFSLKEILQLIQVMKNYGCLYYWKQKSEQDMVTSGQIIELLLISNLDLQMLREQKDRGQKITQFLLSTIDEFIVAEQKKETLKNFLTHQ